MADNLLPGRYAVGAASVDAGGTVVTPTGATWTDNVWGDDLFFLPSQPLVPPQRVESVNGDGELVLAYPWPGDAAIEEPYEVRFVGIIERSTAQSRRVLEQLGDVKAWADIFVATDADRLGLESPTNPLPAGRRVLVIDDGLIWAKKTGAYDDWQPPAAFKGDAGSKGWSPKLVSEADGERRVFRLAGYVGGEGTAPTDNVGQYLKADGTWTATIGDAEDFRGEGFVFVEGGYDNEFAYGKGNVINEAGSAWITLQPTIGNAPPTLPTISNAYWRLLVRKGNDGAGTIAGIVGGTGVSIDVTDPTEPVISVVGQASFEQLLTYQGSSALELAEDRVSGPVSAGPDGNGLYDGFNTLDNVDVAGASGLVTSTAGELNMVNDTPISAMTPQSISSDSLDFAGQNLIQIIAASAISGTGTQIRFRLIGHSTNTAVFTGMTIGHAAASGDVYDTAATPVAVTVAGVAGFTLAIGANVWSDWITFPYDETKNLILKAHISSGRIRYNNTPTSAYTYYTKTSASEIATANVSGYTLGPSGTPAGQRCYIVSEIEVRSSPAALEVEGEDNNLSEAPEWGFLNCFVDLNGATLNTDVTFSISRDGSEYLPLTMTEKYTRPDGTVCIDSGIVDLTGIDSGTIGKWKIEALSGESVSFKAIGILFGGNS